MGRVDVEFVDVELQCSHDSSLPVSRTIVTFCGGEPTDKDTVKVTLWWNGSLFGDLGNDPVGISWVFKGKTSIWLVVAKVM